MANEVSSRSAVDERRMSAWIGTGLVVQGKVISTQDLTIDGKVEGTIEVGNHGLTIGRAPRSRPISSHRPSPSAGQSPATSPPRPSSTRARVGIG